MKISAPFIASERSPVFCSKLVTSIISFCIQFRSGEDFERIPLIPQIVTCLKPYKSKSFVIAMPAEPSPLTTTLQFSFFLPTIFKALIIPASTTIAVPCWSSWKTGIDKASFKRASISKQRGAEISSRLIPPNAGAIRITVSIISSVSCVSKQIGNALTLPNSLKRTAFPSMTGMAASGPILPRPSTALPSETTAIVLDLIV